MHVILVTTSNPSTLENDLNRTLLDLFYKGSRINDIKYTHSMVVKGDEVVDLYTALIMYE